MSSTRLIFKLTAIGFHSHAERDKLQLRSYVPDTAEFRLGRSRSLRTWWETLSCKICSVSNEHAVCRIRAQAGTGALQYNTSGKSLNQEQLGGDLREQLNAADTPSTFMTLYTGHRATTQFQAIPMHERDAAIRAASSTGVVVYWVAHPHAADQRNLAGMPVKMSWASTTTICRRHAAAIRISSIGMAPGAQPRRKRIMSTISTSTCRCSGDPAAAPAHHRRVRHLQVTTGHLAVIDGAYRSVRYSAVSPVGGITSVRGAASICAGSYGSGVRDADAQRSRVSVHQRERSRGLSRRVACRAQRQLRGGDQGGRCGAAWLCSRCFMWRRGMSLRVLQNFSAGRWIRTYDPHARRR